jgi:hypothetical protein
MNTTSTLGSLPIDLVLTRLRLEERGRCGLITFKCLLGGGGDYTILLALVKGRGLPIHFLPLGKL